VRIKLRTTYASPKGAYGPGSVIDLPDAQARDLVEGGYATAIDTPAQKGAPVEMAVQEPIETTSTRKASTIKKGRRGKAKTKLGNSSGD